MAITTDSSTANKTFCTGTLIANDTVLTAAHCIDCGSSQCAMTVRFRDPSTGCIDLDGCPDSVANISGVGVPRRDPNISGSEPDDVAIVKLAHPAPGFIRPMTTARSNPPQGTTVTVAGFGHTGSECELMTPVVNPVLAEQNYPIDDYSSDGLAESNTLATCQSDSGGPNIWETGDSLDMSLLFGVTSGFRSFNIKLYSYDRIGAATTTYNNSWIKSHLCFSSLQNYCTGNGDPCSCTASPSVIWVNTSNVLALWQLNGNRFDERYPGTLPGTFRVVGAGDFDGDHHQDLLLRDASGQPQIWFLNGDGALRSAVNVGGPDPWHVWAIQNVADFDGDGRSDILWRDTSGLLAIWFSANNSTVAFPSYQNAGGRVSLEWQVIGSGDFDGDGRADILWRDTASGQIAIWHMNGGSFVFDSYPGVVAADEVFQGIGDFNGDIKADILWRRASGALETWFAGGDGAKAAGPSWQNSLTGGSPSPVNTNFEIVGIIDVDHDGRDDLVWRDASHNGFISLWLLDGIRYVGEYAATGIHDTGPRFVDSSWTTSGTFRERGF